MLTGYVPYSWSMTGPSHPAFPRKLLQQKLINKAPIKHAHDDEWTFNSQCSSQWDGPRHYAYQKEKVSNSSVERILSDTRKGILHGENG